MKYPHIFRPEERRPRAAMLTPYASSTRRRVLFLQILAACIMGALIGAAFAFGLIRTTPTP